MSKSILILGSEGFIGSHLVHYFRNSNYEVFGADIVLKQAKDYFRRNRDFTVILSGLAYALNIVDANVTAHLKDFDLSDDLSLSVQPSVDQVAGLPVTGVSLTLHLK